MACAMDCCRTASRSLAQRYIELNPVRAGMVTHPAAYRWSSYGTNAQGDTNPLITPHALYLALASDAGSRQAAYRELFRYELDPDVVDEIRKAANGNFALGGEQFAAQVATAMGIRATRGEPGRPRKTLELESGDLLGY